MLGLLSAPRVEELEALIAEGGSALRAALGGLERRGLAQLAQDGASHTHALAVPLHHTLQGEVPEETRQAPLPQLHIALAGWAREHDHWGVQSTSLPPGVCPKACGRR